MDRTIALLADEHPGCDWRDRIVSIADGGAWPFPADFFHCVFSNQVFEHVRNHAFLLGEIRRTLRPDGVSAHLFPLRHYVYEGHLHLPFVHRIRNTDMSRAYIRACSRLGLGKFPGFHKASGISLEDFTERHADYLHYFTNYLTQTEVVTLAKRQRLRVSFRYTQGFYVNKVRALAGLEPALTYRRRRSALCDWISTLLLRYVSSVTLFLEKDETYSAARA
jgi:SAM-dependent methyltransferase